MHADEARIKRAELERAIHELLVKFQKETGLVPDAVYLATREFISGRVIEHVTVEVKL